jgi:hypothetical protein
MAKHFYLGRAKDGRIIARASNRSDFKFAGLGAHASSRLPSFAKDAAGAIKNAENNGWKAPIEVVPVELVDSAAYRKALAERGSARAY